MALHFGATADDVIELIHVYPTMAEALKLEKSGYCEKGSESRAVHRAKVSNTWCGAELPPGTAEAAHGFLRDVLPIDPSGVQVPLDHEPLDQCGQHLRLNGDS